MNISEELFHLFMELPPNFDNIVQLLNSDHCTRECINVSFCKFAEECFCEYSGFIEQHSRKPLDEEIHSTYVASLCELLLKHGLDPNYVFGDEGSEANIMHEVYYIDKPYVAADTLRLLLEKGGNPLLDVGGESIWKLSDFDIWFDVSYGYAQQEHYKMKFDSSFHFWLVLRGFLSPDEEKYKDHSLYTYHLIQIDKDHRDIQIIPK